eukprot:967742-Pyramimonas_sp.AAC.1
MPQSYQLRFLDVLHAWERNPIDMPLFLMLISFLPKPPPGGGVRPIVLNCLWLRLWSRLRQPLVA